MKVSIVCDAEFAKRITAASFLKDGGEASKLVKAAAEDGYDRLIAPSVEREVRARLFDDASEQAIKDVYKRQKQSRPKVLCGAVSKNLFTIPRLLRKPT